MSETEIEEMRRMFAGPSPLASDEEFYESMRQGWEVRKLNNDGYRLHLAAPGSDPFKDLGKPGYEAETREILRLADEMNQETNE